MKFLTTISLALLLLIGLAGCGGAAAHHNKITDICNSAANDYESLISKIFIAKNFTEGKEELATFSAAMKKGKDKLRAMETLQGNDEYRQAAIIYLDVLDNTSINEISEYVELSLKADKVLSEEGDNLLADDYDYSALEKNVKRRKELMEQIDNNLTIIDRDIHNARKAFILKNKLEE